MKDLGLHILLFLVISAAIVLSSAFFSERDDRRALASFPRRYMVFVIGCSVLAGILLLIGATFASIR